MAEVQDARYYRGCFCGADLWLEVEVPGTGRLADSVSIPCPACGKLVALEPFLSDDIV